jgi:hypothetical protein
LMQGGPLRASTTGGRSAMMKLNHGSIGSRGIELDLGGHGHGVFRRESSLDTTRSSLGGRNSGLAPKLCATKLTSNRVPPHLVDVAASPNGRGFFFEVDEAAARWEFRAPCKNKS